MNDRPSPLIADVPESTSRRSDCSDLITDFRVIVDPRRRIWRAVRIKDGSEFDHGILDGRINAASRLPLTALL